MALKRPDYVDPKSIRYKFRKRRFRIIESLIDSVVRKQGHATIIDIGGTARYWSLLDPRLGPSCKITLVNHANWLQPSETTLPNGVQFTNHLGDGCNLIDFADRQFDLAHSNSVVEHVGSLKRMAAFADETRRVGRSYYCQTPYLWFPIEPHYGVPFFHWLPGPTRANLSHKYELGWHKRFDNYGEALENADHTQLLDITLFRRLFPDATFYWERAALLVKSLVAYRFNPVEP